MKTMAIFHLATKNNADLSSLQQIRGMGADIRRKNYKLEILINNAGVAMKKLEYSHDGYEMTFAVNHLAVFAITFLLLDLLKQAAPDRIIFVNSMVYSSSMSFEYLLEPLFFDGWEAYCQSKLRNISFTYELTEKPQRSWNDPKLPASRCDRHHAAQG